MKTKYDLKIRSSKNMISAALLSLLVAALACLAAPSPLLADNIGLSLTAEANTGFVGGSQIFQVSGATTPINDPVQTAAYSSSAGGVFTDSASASGSVNFGSISGDVTTSADASSSDLSTLPGTGLGGAGQGLFIGEWQDSIAVTSATLADGTPVNLLFTLAVNGSLGCSGSGALVNANAEFEAEGYGDIVAASSTCNSTLQGAQTLTVATTVGADIPVEGVLSLQADGDFVNDESSSATVDPPSSQFYIDSETAGASYATGSGVSYMTPQAPPTTTPEPSSVLLLGVGLLGLAGASLRK